MQGSRGPDRSMLTRASLTGRAPVALPRSGWRTRVRGRGETPASARCRGQIGDEMVRGARLRSRRRDGRWAVTAIALMALFIGTVVKPSPAAADSPLSGSLTQLTSELAPTVTKVAPDTGPVSGGTAVTLFGSNFTGATEVAFGSTPAVFTVNSANKIAAEAPPGTEGVVDVAVTTPEGTSAISSQDRFCYVPPGPSVLEVSPDEGHVNRWPGNQSPRCALRRGDRSHLWREKCCLCGRLAGSDPGHSS